MMDVCNLGGGGYFYGDYFYVNWVLDLFEVVDKYINIKEILVIIFVLQCWVLLFFNKKVIVYIDNIMVRVNINKGVSKNIFIMDWFRSFFWI